MSSPVLTGKMPAAGLLLQFENRVLLTHRSPWMRDGDRWATPGGVAEDGETPFQTAARETLEELEINVTTENVQLVGVHTNYHRGRYYTVLHCLVPAEYRIGTIDEENQNAEWIDIADALKLPLHPQLRYLLNDIQHQEG